MAFNVNKCKLLYITYCKSTVTKHMCNIYQLNSLSDSIPPVLALLAEKHLGFSLPTTNFIQIQETQNKRYLCVISDNKLSFNQYIGEVSKSYQSRVLFIQVFHKLC